MPKKNKNPERDQYQKVIKQALESRKSNRSDMIVMCEMTNMLFAMPAHYRAALTELSNYTGSTVQALIRHSIDFYLNYGPHAQKAQAETRILSGGHPIFDVFHKKLEKALEPVEHNGKILTTCGTDGKHSFKITEKIINSIQRYAPIDYLASIKYFIWLGIYCDCELYQSPEIHYPILYHDELLVSTDWRDFAIKEALYESKRRQFDEEPGDSSEDTLFGSSDTD